MSDDISSCGPTVSEYLPSGHVNLLRFIPLFGAAFFVSIILAVILLFLESDLYYFIFTPLLLGLPLYGMIYLMARFGHCRNKLLGALTGLVLALTYYVGYWELSYLGNVVIEGPETVHLVREKGGAPGLVGYLFFRAKNMVIEDTPSYSSGEQSHDFGDEAFSYVFYGIEFLMISAIGFFIGFTVCGNVYYENRKKWCNALSIRYNPADFAPIAAAVRAEDWMALSRFPRLPKFTSNTAQTPVLSLKIEYLKGGPEEPVYVTLSGTNLGRVPGAKEHGVKGAGGMSKSLVKQKMLTPSSVPLFAYFFPELGFPGIEPDKLEQMRQEVPEPPRVEYSSGLKGALEKMGVIGARTAGPDFREKVIQESRNIVQGSGYSSRLADMRTSLCLPVEPGQEIPVKYLNKATGKSILIFFGCFILGFLFMGLAAFFESRVADNMKFIIPVFGIIGLCMFGVALLVIFSITSLAGRSLKKKLLSRPDALFQAGKGARIELFQIENAANFHIAKKHPDDACLCLLDKANKRLLLEGFTHRYVIQARDVKAVKAVSLGMSPAVEIDWRVGAEDVRMVLAPWMGYTQHIIRPIWARDPSLKLEKRIRETLA